MTNNENVTNWQQLAEEYLQSICQNLDSRQIPYCVLHSYDPLFDGSDIDIALGAPIERIVPLLIATARPKARLIQCLQHEHNAYFYVLAFEIGNSYKFLKLDFCTDYQRDGLTWLPISTLLADRRTCNDIVIPAPAVEAIYLILKRVLKGQITASGVKRIASLLEQDRLGLEVFIARFFGPHERIKLLTLIEKQDLFSWEFSLPRLRRHLFSYNMMRHPGEVISYWRYEVSRKVHRILHPTGLSVVLVGPDGSGKSSIARELSVDLLGPFRHANIFHSRPDILPAMAILVGNRSHAAEAAIQPHKFEPYSSSISLIRLLYYWVDYTLGYWLRVVPSRVCSTLVIFDRYFQDYFVDQRRYRLNLPSAVVLWFVSHIPNPDIVIYLDCEVETLCRRKMELSPEELQRQRDVWLNYIHRISHGVTIHVLADEDLLSTTHRVAQVITRFLECRFASES